MLLESRVMSMQLPSTAQPYELQQAAKEVIVSDHIEPKAEDTRDERYTKYVRLLKFGA